MGLSSYLLVNVVDIGAKEGGGPTTLQISAYRNTERSIAHLNPEVPADQMFAHAIDSLCPVFDSTGRVLHNCYFNKPIATGPSIQPSS